MESEDFCLVCQHPFHGPGILPFAELVVERVELLSKAFSELPGRRFYPLAETSGGGSIAGKPAQHRQRPLQLVGFQTSLGERLLVGPGEHGRLPPRAQTIGQGALVAEKPLQELFLDSDRGEGQCTNVPGNEVAVRRHVLDCVGQDPGPRLLAQPLPEYSARTLRHAPGSAHSGLRWE